MLKRRSLRCAARPSGTRSRLATNRGPDRTRRRREGLAAGRDQGASRTFRRRAWRTAASCATSTTTSSSCSSTTSSSCSSTTSSSTPLAPAGAATSCSGDGDVLPTVKVGWPAARAAGRGCAAGVLDLYYYSIPGGVAALAAAHLAPPALGWRRRWARGALAPRVRIATQHPYSRSSRARSPGVLGLRLVCVLDVGSIFRSPTRRRCAPCSAALAPHWAPPYGL